MVWGTHGYNTHMHLQDRLLLNFARAPATDSASGMRIADSSARHCYPASSKEIQSDCLRGYLGGFIFVWIIDRPIPASQPRLSHSCYRGGATVVQWYEVGCTWVMVCIHVLTSVLSSVSAQIAYEG